MAYTLSWYAPAQVLYLALDGQLTIQELREANGEILHILNNHDQRINILIDETHMETGYSTADQLRETQKYMNHPQLEAAIVVASKLNRLINLIAFSVVRTPIMQFENFEAASQYLRRRGFQSDLVLTS